VSANSFFAKFLRFIGILLMGITALFTIASGVGTTCVAFNPTGFGDSMAPLAPFQWLYILFVIVTTVIGIMAARAVVLLAKGKSNSYRDAIIALVLGIAVGVIHMVVSRSLRGKSMPVDGVVYTTVLTLIVFLLFRIPKVWQGVDYTAGDTNDKTGRMAAAITLLVTGLLTLTVQYWAGPTHTWDNTNWADAWHLSMWLLGSGLVLGGLFTAFWERLPLRKLSLATGPSRN